MVWAAIHQPNPKTAAAVRATVTAPRQSRPPETTSPSRTPLTSAQVKPANDDARPTSASASTTTSAVTTNQGEAGDPSERTC
ncbi:MAG: hypothetical protein ABS81_16225 [Pseudonocardia sp. SCN 72-86]|nr:MAG: hypothetical protein ABS81_16225 [Pseudonocardia sp. SCN 72-86]